jgi:hypothetical protein
VEMRIFVENLPDADVTAKFRCTPQVRDGILSMEIPPPELDVDTGLLGDLLGFLTGAGLGELLGLLLGGLVLAAVGGVGGVVAVEITEDVLEDISNDQAGAARLAVGITNAFSTFAVHNRTFSDRRDPLFVCHHQVVHRYNEVKVDTNGMSFAGRAAIETVNEPLRNVSIVNKERGTGTESWNGLVSLTYRTPSGEVVLPTSEVLRRLPLHELARVPLTPTHIRRKKTVVTDILFDSGLDIYVAESVALQDEGALVVRGYQLIHPRNYNSYYRARADDRVDNNFESLPRF